MRQPSCRTLSFGERPTHRLPLRLRGLPADVFARFGEHLVACLEGEDVEAIFVQDVTAG